MHKRKLLQAILLSVGVLAVGDVLSEIYRWVDEKGIKYKEYDVEKSAKGKSEYRRLGAKGVPVILVGKRRMNGFSVDGFEKLYR